MSHDEDKALGIPLDQSGSADPFNVEGLRLSQDFASSIGVKKLLTTVPVRKPDSQAFVRVHPDEAYRLETAVLELKEEREIYLVDKRLWPELPGEIIPKVLFTTITRQGVVFLWPIRLPGEDGRIDDWNRSALEAAHKAMGSWIRVVSNRSLGGYELLQAVGDIPDPSWPEHSFQELLRVAFKGRFVRDLEHPALLRLRGMR